MITIRTAIAAALVFLAASEPTRAEHPPVTLVDHDGRNVIESGKPISTMRSCNHCHDTQYIATHSYHVSLGSDETAAPGTISGGRAWDWSPGAFGRWNPLDYRYLTPYGDSRLDQGTAAWIAGFHRHAGGGPAWFGQKGRPLAERALDGQRDPDAFVLDLRGTPQPWDWQKSGVVEMNCFVCHTPKPDNSARIRELDAGRFQWANTATLASTTLIRRTQDGWAYQREAFLPDGRVDARRLGVREPKSENCGLCHGRVDRGVEPVNLEFSLAQWSTATKGQVFSPQRISESALNLKDKEHLARPWDVHAERLLECTSCHFSTSNPAFHEPTPRTQPKHLKFDPRRLTVGEYLKRPSHQFAKGHTSQGTLARNLDGTMRRCEGCHNAADAHNWLPYQEAHFSRLSCEACHVPQVYSPAIRQVDWTLLTPSGDPQIRWRGIAGDPANPTAPVDGFRPVLLPAQGMNGRTRLVPHNLISAWYWVEGGATPRPVRLIDLKAAILQNGKYHPEVAAVLEIHGGQPATTNTFLLDTPARVDAVRRRLEAVGVVQPHIEAEIQPYSLHHGIGPAKWATRKCETCHTADSRLSERFALASYAPGGILPKLVADSGIELNGQLQIGSDGQLDYQPSTRQASLYVLGHNRWNWINVLGALSLLTVVVGVVVHAGLRAVTARSGIGAAGSTTAADPTEETHP
jgi:hypothetical protein